MRGSMRAFDRRVRRLVGGLASRDRGLFGLLTVLLGVHLELRPSHCEPPIVQLVSLLPIVPPLGCNREALCDNGEHDCNLRDHRR